MERDKITEDYMVRKFIAYKERITKMVVDAQSELATPEFVYLLAVHKRKVDSALEAIGEIEEVYSALVKVAQEFAQDWDEKGIEYLLEQCPKCKKRETCSLKNFLQGLRGLGCEF